MQRLPDWHFQYHNDEAVEEAQKDLLAADTLLMGRETYDVYSQAWPAREGEYADCINSMEKIVASTTLEEPTWNNSRVIEGDLVEEVTKIKQKPGKNILMHGYGPVARTLIQNQLLDEIRLWVHPIFGGVGAPADLLFREGVSSPLKLIDNKELSNGLVIPLLRATTSCVTIAVVCRSRPAHNTSQCPR